MTRLSGKVSIVTGGATGIGAGTARRLAAEGSSVVIADLNVEAAGALVDELRRDGAVAEVVQTDVSDEGQVRDLVATVVDELGGLDVLFNNAAILSVDHISDDIAAVDVPVEVWDRTFAVNARGVMLGCKYAIPAMQARGGGSIINTSSVSSLYGDPGLFAYGASKGAVSTLTRHVATTYGRTGVRCNAVLPGPIVTENLERLMTDEDFKLLERQVTGPRLGRPEDIGAAVAFLASDDAAYVNGALLVVDGGWSAKAPHWADWTDLRPALQDSPRASLGEWVTSLGGV